MITHEEFEKFKSEYEGKEFYPDQLTLEIDPVFENFLTGLTSIENKTLEDLMVKEMKCKRPIDVVLKEADKDGKKTIVPVILDGHNRNKNCLKHNIPFKINVPDHLDYTDKLACMEYMLQNQEGQRSLNKYRRCIVALNMEEELKKKAKENQQKSAGRGKKGSQIVANLKVDVYKELAEIAGISSETIRKVKRIEEFATAEIKEKLRGEQISINQAYKQIEKFVKKNEKIDTQKKITEAVIADAGDVVSEVKEDVVSEDAVLEATETIEDIEAAVSETTEATVDTKDIPEPTSPEAELKPETEEKEEKPDISSESSGGEEPESPRLAVEEMKAETTVVKAKSSLSPVKKEEVPGRTNMIKVKINPKKLPLYSNMVDDYKSGNYKNVLEACDKWIVKVLNLKGFSLHGLKCYEKAIDCFDMLININSKYFLAWFNRGKVQVDLDRKEDALLSFENALSYAPEEYKIKIQDEINFLEAKEKTEAEKEKRKVGVDAEPEVEEVSGNDIRTEEEAPKIEEDSEDEEDEPSENDIFQQLYAYINANYEEDENSEEDTNEKEEPENVEEDSEDEEDESSEDKEYTENLYQEGVKLIEDKDYEAALESFDKTLEINPKNTDADECKKDCLSKLKKKKKTKVKKQKKTKVKKQKKEKVKKSKT